MLSSPYSITRRYPEANLVSNFSNIILLHSILLDGVQEVLNSRAIYS